MILPNDPLFAVAVGVFALILLLVARKIKPKTGNDPRRNLVIVINDKTLKAMQS